MVFPVHQPITNLYYATYNLSEHIVFFKVMFIYICFAEMQLLTLICENTNNCGINKLCFLHIIFAVNNYLHNNTNAILLKINRVMLLHNFFDPIINFFLNIICSCFLYNNRKIIATS